MTFANNHQFHFRSAIRWMNFCSGVNFNQHAQCHCTDLYRHFWKLKMWKASNDFYCRLSNNRLLFVWNVTPYIPLHQISDTATHLRMQMSCKLVHLISQLSNLIMSWSMQLNELKMSNYWLSLAIATAWNMSWTCISHYFPFITKL